VTAPLALYGAALRLAARGSSVPLQLVPSLDAGPRQVVDAADWSGGLRPGDSAMLDRCRGATLDVGCGPGRLAAALARRGQVALGVDISAEAVRQTRRRGAVAIRGCVFGPLPREGAWRTILLADGNIGIGGDPHRLLRRCAGLVRDRGAVLIEVEPPGVTSWRAEVVLRHGGRESAAFPWAGVGADDVAGLARRCSLRVRRMWTEADRWFTDLTPG
jgi:SAM-dependent methyltransferase